MFVSGMAAWLRVPMMITTIIIAVPTGVKMWSWLATLWQGKIHMKTPMLWALGFLFTFLMGGLSGVFLGVVPIDIQVSDTYFVTAHLHYVLYGGSVYTVFAGIYYWFPKMTGKMYSEKAALWSFILIIIGFNVTFFPQFIAGSQGMPRRYWNYLPEFTTLNQISTIGSWFLGVGFLWTAIYLLKAVFSGPKAGPNPWNALTLEWQTPSPPPHENFKDTPTVTQWPYDYRSQTI
jgi:cytochrome c oxidase subunit 1